MRNRALSGISNHDDYFQFAVVAFQFRCDVWQVHVNRGGLTSNLRTGTVREGVGIASVDVLRGLAGAVVRRTENVSFLGMGHADLRVLIEVRPQRGGPALLRPDHHKINQWFVLFSHRSKIKGLDGKCMGLKSIRKSRKRSH